MKIPFCFHPSIVLRLDLDSVACGLRTSCAYITLIVVVHDRRDLRRAVGAVLRGKSGDSSDRRLLSGLENAARMALDRYLLVVIKIYTCMICH